MEPEQTKLTSRITWHTGQDSTSQSKKGGLINSWWVRFERIVTVSFLATAWLFSSAHSQAAAPAFSGFDFSLSEGDFWEYKWDRAYESWDSDENYYGRFRITLGSAKNINGILAYKVNLSGSLDDIGIPPFRWKYLAIADNRILGSEDGLTLVTVFDAQTGQWVGNSFFGSVPSDELITATAGSIDNNYISGSAVAAQVVEGSDRCEYYPGGSICKAESEKRITTNYFMPGIGSVGLYFSYERDSVDWQARFSSTINVGLVASSLSGDKLDYELETEPNDSSGMAQAIQLPTTIFGEVSEYDQSDKDWFTFTLESWARVTIKLLIDGSTTTDLDLYLLNDANQVLASSIQDNPKLGDFTEQIVKTLPPGKYYIQVHAYSGVASYLLQASEAPAPDVSSIIIPIITTILLDDAAEQPPTQPPTAPTNPTVSSITADSAVLGWMDNSTIETGFEIGGCTGLVTVSSSGVRNCVSGFWTLTTVSADTQSYTLTGLDSSTWYSWYVRAYNAAGYSSNVGIAFTTIEGQ